MRAAAAVRHDRPLAGSGLVRRHAARARLFRTSDTSSSHIVATSSSQRRSGCCGTESTAQGLKRPTGSVGSVTSIRRLAAVSRSLAPSSPGRAGAAQAPLRARRSRASRSRCPSRRWRRRPRRRWSTSTRSAASRAAAIRCSTIRSSAASSATAARRAARAGAALARLGRHRRSARAGRHQPPRHRGRGRGQGRAGRQARVRGRDRAARSAHRSRGAAAQGAAAPFAGDRARRFRRAGGRRPRAGHRQSVRRRPDGDAGHRLGAGPHARWASATTSSSSRPTRPSIPAIPAARWSTCPGGWSASIRRSSPARAAATASASPSRPTWSGWWSESAKSGGKQVQRPWLGARLQAVTADIAESLGLPRPTGALVADVPNGTPAAKAGLKRGDVIVAIDGQMVDDPDALGFRLATRPVGGKAVLTVRRGANEMPLPIGLEAAPETSAARRRGHQVPLALRRRHGGGAGRRPWPTSCVCRHRRRGRRGGGEGGARLAGRQSRLPARRRRSLQVNGA